MKLITNIPAITEMMRSFGHNIYGAWGDIVHKTTWWTNDVLDYGGDL